MNLTEQQFLATLAPWQQNEGKQLWRTWIKYSTGKYRGSGFASGTVDPALVRS